MKRLLAMVIAASTLCLSAVALTAAQDDEEEEGDEEEAPAAPEAPPTTTGAASAQAAVGQAGMTFELRTKARIYVPPRLPIGSSRRMRFAESRGRFVPGEVAPGFRRIGPVLSFDGAINATSSPVIVSIRQPRDPATRAQRLVLAMEHTTLCNMPGAHPMPGQEGLCLGWELIDARFAAAEGRLIAELRNPGGHRLVFGTVPAEAPAGG
jgi:hypothetical protein